MNVLMYANKATDKAVRGQQRVCFKWSVQDSSMERSYVVLLMCVNKAIRVLF